MWSTADAPPPAGPSPPRCKADRADRRTLPAPTVVGDDRGRERTRAGASVLIEKIPHISTTAIPTKPAPGSEQGSGPILGMGTGLRRYGEKEVGVTKSLEFSITKLAKKPISSACQPAGRRELRGPAAGPRSTGASRTAGCRRGYGTEAGPPTGCSAQNPSSPCPAWVTKVVCGATELPSGASPSGQ